MKKSNFMTLLLLCFLSISVLIFDSKFFQTTKESDTLSYESSDFNLTVTDTVSLEQSENLISNSLPKTSLTPIPTIESNIVKETTEKIDETIESTADRTTLFIGDSRTVGIMEYAGLTNADFFCNAGMSVFNIQKNRISVPTIGKVTLTELLSGKQYDIIYIMLGINELGYDFQSIIEKYKELYDFIRIYQPESTIFLQANLHVTKKRSENDKYINNTAIDYLNAEIAKLADNSNSFYLNVNPIFDDENGNLAAENSFDNVHLYGKHYIEWGNWLSDETEKVLGRDSLD